jgi:hypothetical protein
MWTRAAKLSRKLLSHAESNLDSQPVSKMETKLVAVYLE